MSAYRVRDQRSDHRRSGISCSYSLAITMTSSQHIYEIRPRADKHGFDLSSDTLPYSPLWYRGLNAIVDAVGGLCKVLQPAIPIVIRIYDDAGNLI